jgi:hypothetical protein
MDAVGGKDQRIQTSGGTAKGGTGRERLDEGGGDPAGSPRTRGVGRRRGAAPSLEHAQGGPLGPPYKDT